MLGDRVKQARKAKGISRKSLAERVGMPYSTLAEIENVPQQDTTRLLELARELGVRPEWLKTGKGERDESVKVQPGAQSQSVTLDPSTMLAALRYLERRFAEAGQRFDPFADTDLLCWAYEVESAETPTPSNIVDFGRKLFERTQGAGKHGSGRSGSADK